MAAYVTDLQIIEREDGPWFQFSWEGAKGDWDATLEGVKRIPPEAREWDPDDRVWRVAEAFEGELCEIFSNFAAALDGIRSQLGLLG
jgi:hypothetical protein